MESYINYKKHNMCCKSINLKRGDFLENELSFDERFEALGEYFNVESPGEIRKQFEKNENIFVLLDGLKPFLEKSFCDAEFSLEINIEPEMDDNFVILRVNVPEERFNNGVSEEIRSLDLKIWDLRRDIQVFRDLSIMPGIKDV